jgi:4-aminobutyrate aminotransferase
LIEIPMWLFDNRSVPDLQTPLPGPKAKALLERDSRVISPSYTRGYPLVVNRGSGAVIEDVDGNLFLDCTAGIAVTATGHCHPDVVKAISDQAGKLIHMSGTDFYYEPEIALAERLAKLAPGSSPKKIFFTNSGTEAIEGALKLARYHTGRPNVLAFFGAFHGRTYGAMSLSASKLVHRKRFGPLVPHMHHVPFPRDHQNCKLPATCDCIEIINETVFKRTAPPDEVAAIFVEPIQGEGGYHAASPAFLQALRRLCDQHGIMLVADEIQSGMGRTGKLFAIEYSEVEPDILCAAKGIASGLPLGAIIAKTSIMTWPSGSHASTFGGNPVACRAALATLDLLEKEFLHNARARGEELATGLRQLAAKHAHILGEVRAMGLMIAVDVHTDSQPNSSLRNKLEDLCYEQGLLILGCGDSSLRICPPLCITIEQIQTALRILDSVFRQSQRFSP